MGCDVNAIVEKITADVMVKAKGWRACCTTTIPREFSPFLNIPKVVKSLAQAAESVIAEVISLILA